MNNINITNLEVEASLWSLLEQIEDAEFQITSSIPQQHYATLQGEINPNTYWGAVIRNLRITRSTILAQLTQKDNVRGA